MKYTVEQLLVEENVYQILFENDECSFDEYLLAFDTLDQHQKISLASNILLNCPINSLTSLSIRLSGFNTNASTFNKLLSDGLTLTLKLKSLCEKRNIHCDQVLHGLVNNNQNTLELFSDLTKKLLDRLLTNEAITHLVNRTSENSRINLINQLNFLIPQHRAINEIRNQFNEQSLQTLGLNNNTIGNNFMKNRTLSSHEDYLTNLDSSTNFEQ